MAHSTTSSSGSSQASSDSDSGKVKKASSQKRKIDETDSDSDSDSDSSNSSPEVKKKESSKEKRKHKVLEEDVEEKEVKVLSHKEQRRLKKKQKLMENEDGPEGQSAEADESKEGGGKQTSKKKNGKEKKKKSDESESQPKRQNSVWVGNLSFKTTEEALKNFFDGVGEITRVHMPKKSNPGAPKMSRPENRGFAYVDFATPEARTLAVTLSEKNLDGRKLLIKSGEDYTGRPAPATVTTLGTNGEAEAGPSTGLTKTAQKILSSQKQPAGPCLFLGNLGFEATDERIREMFEGHARSWATKQAEREREKARKREKAKSKGKDDDLMDTNTNDDDEKEESAIEVEIDVGIKKVRMGTFEDTGVCKGFAFVDFNSTAHATAALTNPRNHYLDGRTLKVEYASPDAARRGGYREKGVGGGKNDGSRPSKKASEGRARDGHAPKRKWGESEVDNESGAAYESNTDQTGRHEAEQNSKTKWPRQDDKNSKHRRPKPGAALAMAKRENVAIVPSEGTRLTFT